MIMFFIIYCILCSQNEKNINYNFIEKIFDIDDLLIMYLYSFLLIIQ